MRKALRALRCASDRAVELMAYTLQGSVGQWYKAFLDSKTVTRLLPPLWEEFTKSFLARFLLINKWEDLVAEFKRLWQTVGMSVAEYDAHFTRLSRYTPHLVAIDTINVRKFVRGLLDPMFTTFSLEVRRMSYAEIVNATYGIESRREEEGL